MGTAKIRNLMGVISLIKSQIIQEYILLNAYAQ